MLPELRKLCWLMSVMTISVSCALTSKYSDNQHAAFARMLSAEEKSEINETGEITQNAEFGSSSPGFVLRGKYRILKTKDPTVFNFVEVGRWITHSESPQRRFTHPIQFRDTTIYDTLGNILNRVVYDLVESDYKKTNEWTSSMEGGNFIQHVKAYNNDTLRAEYSRKVLDYKKPMSDRLKRKVPAGAEKTYRSDGTLWREKTYNPSGKLISEKKY